MPKTIVHLRLERSLQQRAKRMAARHGLSFADLIRLFLHAYVRNPRIRLGAFEDLCKPKGRK